MAIIRRKLGNNRKIIIQKFREIRDDGLGGLAFFMFCEGWKSAWEECINQSPKLRNERIEELEAIIKNVCNLINNKGHVSKWKIYNWLEPILKGK